MGTHHHKLYTTYTASEGVYKQLAETVVRWCARRKIDLQRFSEISGVAMDRLERLMKPKPKFITVAEYSQIRSALNNQLPLHIIQGAAQESTASADPAPAREPVREEPSIMGYPAPINTPDPAPATRTDATELREQLLTEVAVLIDRYGLTKAAISRWAGYSDGYLSAVIQGHKNPTSPKLFEKLLDLVTYRDGLPPELAAVATRDVVVAAAADTYPTVEEPLVPLVNQPVGAREWTVVSRRYVEEVFVVSGATIDEALTNFRSTPNLQAQEATAVGDAEIVQIARVKE